MNMKRHHNSQNFFLCVCVYVRNSHSHEEIDSTVEKFLQEIYARPDVVGGTPIFVSEERKRGGQDRGS